MQAFTLETSHKHALHGEQWPVKDPNALLCVVHGHGEYIGRYAGLATHLNRKGIAVMGYDLIGHGDSPGKRGHFPSLDEVLDSIASLLAKGRAQYPGVPVFLMGHSMGGNLVSQFVLRRKPDLTGVVLSAPWFQPAFEPPKLDLILASLMYRVYPAFGQATKLDAKGISRDPAEVKVYQDDPKIHDLMTPGLYVPVTEGADYVMEAASDWSLPLLVYHGTDDPIISFDAAKAFADKAGGGDVTFQPWEGARHEPHYDTERDRIIEFLGNWVLERGS